MPLSSAADHLAGLFLCTADYYISFIYNAYIHWLGVNVRLRSTILPYQPSVSWADDMMLNFGQLL